MDGSDTPLMEYGNFKEYLCAFARRGEGKAVLAVVPRFLSNLLKDTGKMSFGKEVCGDTGVVIPDEMTGGNFRHIFTDETLKRVKQEGKDVFLAGELFAHFPVALLKRPTIRINHEEEESEDHTCFQSPTSRKRNSAQRTFR